MRVTHPFHRLAGRDFLSPSAPAAARCASGLSSGGLLGLLPRPGRVLLAIADRGLGLGRPGLRAAHRSVPLLPRRGHLLLRGLSRGHRLLLGGSLRSHRPRQPRAGLLRRGARLPGLSLGPLGAGLKRGRASSAAAIWASSPARSRAASSRACATCHGPDWRR